MDEILKLKNLASISEICFDLRERIENIVTDNSWICPIVNAEYQQSYYTISKNKIVILDRAQFADNEEYFGLLTHMMSHSVRDFTKNQIDCGSGYAEEELVCECCSALILSLMGMKKRLCEDSMAYERSWRINWEDDKYRTRIEDKVRDRFFSVIVNILNCSLTYSRP